MKKKLLSVLLAGVMLSAALTGCSGGDKTIKIGAVGPLTGADSYAGIDEINGKNMAVADFNAAGGIDGVMVELISEDDAGDATQSATAITKLITQNEVVGIVGAFNSACTLAGLEVINRYEVPMITSGSSSPFVLTSGCEWISRAFPGDVQSAIALMNYSTDTLGAEKIGIIYVNDDYGVGGLDAVSSAADAAGVEWVAESFGGTDTDMTAQLASLQAQDVDLLFIWCQSTPGSYIMKQTRALGWDVQMISGTGTMHVDTFELSDNAYVGTINSVPFTTVSTDPDVQAWVAEYEEIYDMTPSQNSARGYDATMMLLNAIASCGSTDAADIQNALRHTVDYDGLQGVISIDPATGEYMGTVQIVQAAEGGTWDYLVSEIAY